MEERRDQLLEFRILIRRKGGEFRFTIVSFSFQTMNLFVATEVHASVNLFYFPHDTLHSAILHSAVGSLLPGEEVIMFISNLRDVKDTSSPHSVVGTSQFCRDRVLVGNEK